MVMLTNGSWTLLRQCLCQGRTCLIQADTEQGLNAQVQAIYLEVSLNQKVQFIDEQTEEEKEDSKHAHSQKEGMAEMMIMTPKDELDGRVDMNELAEYAKEVIQMVKPYLEMVRAGNINILTHIRTMSLLNCTQPETWRCSLPYYLPIIKN
jgi:hypothetical protein